MDKFVYIHGFNSGGNSRSGQELSQLLGVPVCCPEYDYARPFTECLASLRRQIAAFVDTQHDHLTVMGSSLGGFFALQLRHPATVHAVAWNPVVFPAIQLEQFLGLNTRFSDGTDWEFTREILLSYAQAPDPRPWWNELWLYEQDVAGEDRETSEDCPVTPGTQRGALSVTLPRGGVALANHTGDGAERIPRRDIFLADHDELLDARLTRVFWQGAATLHDIASRHQILDYRHAVSLLKEGTSPGTTSAV